MSLRSIGMMLILLVGLVACTSATADPTPTPEAAKAARPTAAAAAATPAAAVGAVSKPPSAKATSPAAQTAPGQTKPPASAAPTAAGAVHWTLQPGTEARYRVREQLANIPAPSDAIGRTEAVTGGIVFGPDGKIVQEQSRIQVDLRTLKSDQSRRDQFIQRNPLQTGTFPNATFVPTQASGLSWPLPASGEVSFELDGDLTIRDVTRPVTWEVTARLGDGAAEGLATTSFTFEEFRLQKPVVASVLSIQDPIRLEIEFKASREA